MCTLRDGIVHECADVLHAAGGCQRPDLHACICWIADGERARAADEPGEKALVDLAGNIYALDRPARLTGAGTAGPQCAANGPSQMRVGEHEHRVLAAELYGDLLLARYACTRDHAPDGGRSGEQDLVDGRLRQRHADVGVAVDDSHEPLG